jgi:hypothetical protein
MNKVTLIRTNYWSTMGSAAFGVLASLLLELLVLSFPVPSGAVSFDISYSVTDDGDPSSFAFNFSEALPNLSTVMGTISLAATMTDAGDGSVSMLVNQKLTLKFSDPADILTSVTFGDVPAFDLSTYSGVPPLPPLLLFATTFPYQFDCFACPWDSIQVAYAFTGSGGGDRYDFIGTMTVDNLNPTSVPEPATLLLFGSGMAGLIGVRRKFMA